MNAIFSNDKMNTVQFGLDYKTAVKFGEISISGSSPEKSDSAILVLPSESIATLCFRVDKQILIEKCCFFEYARQFRDGE